MAWSKKFTETLLDLGAELVMKTSASAWFLWWTWFLGGIRAASATDACEPAGVCSPGVRHSASLGHVPSTAAHHQQLRLWGAHHSPACSEWGFLQEQADFEQSDYFTCRGKNNLSTLKIVHVFGKKCWVSRLYFHMNFNTEHHPYGGQSLCGSRKNVFQYLSISSVQNCLQLLN